MTQAIVPKELLTATPGGLSLLVVSGGSDGDVLTQQSDGTYLPETPVSGGSPGGSSGQFQYNNAGSFGGTVALQYATAGTHVVVTAQASTTIPFAVKGAASQSANLQEWRNSSNTVIASINSDGDVRGARGRFTVDSGVAFVVEAANGTDMLNIATTTMTATFGGSIIFPGGTGKFVGSDSQNGFTIDASYNLIFNAITGVYINIDANASGMAGDFVIAKDRDTASGGTEFFRILESNGNVGIGTASPAAKLDVAGDIFPTTDNAYYLGKNDDDTPKAWKGVVLKDTTNGKYYRIEVISGVVTATDLTD